MNNLIFVDLNKNLVEKVRELGIESYHNDYLDQSRQTPNSVLMTASNPKWTFGGGLDAHICEEYPELCGMKQRAGAGNERINNICFCITVSHRYQATRELVKSALQFAIDNTKEGETLLLMGAGTFIGGLNEDVFVEVLKEVINS